MESLLRCRKFEVVRRQVCATGGGTRPHEFVVHPGAVVILPLLDDGRRVVMLRQFRPALDQEILELPAGTLDQPGEPPAEAATRELEEETGYLPGCLELLCQFYPSPGILTELIRAFVATDLVKTQQRLGPTEKIRVEIMDLAEAIAMVRDSRIVDAKTMITLLRWQMQQRSSA